MNNIQLDQAIFAEINKILTRVQFSVEMIRMIKSSHHKKIQTYLCLLNILKGEIADRFKELTQLAGKGSQRFGNEEQEDIKQLAFNEGAVHYCTVMYDVYRQKSMEIIKKIPVLENRKEKLMKLVEESD